MRKNRWGRASNGGKSYNYGKKPAFYLFFTMKIATGDSGDPEMYFDNPNLRWGSQSYLLEPGDPGFLRLWSGHNIWQFPQFREQTFGRYD